MKRGFTLTELLIVIVVIMTLAGVAFPVGMKMKRNAQSVVCLGKLRQIGVGLEGYLMENSNVMPPLFMGRKTKSDEGAVMEIELLAYVGSDEFAFKCPSDHKHFEESGSSYFWNESLSDIRKDRLTFLGSEADGSVIPMIFDKEAYHGEKKGVNFLYADHSASNTINFQTSSRD